MYNRYLPHARADYAPIPEEYSRANHSATRPGTFPQDSAKVEKEHTKHSLEGLRELFSSLTDRFHLDAGDLLLLAMLFFLYREKADEELLIALGLLLLL